MIEQKKNGGARKGAGRPHKPVHEKTKDRRVTLNDSAVEYLRGLGGGNLSGGIRAAMKIAQQQESGK